MLPPGPLALLPRGRCRLFLLLLVLSSCRDNAVATNAYATLAEAEQAGAISNRWVPLTLPKGAHDIREAHDVEGNRRWGLFSFTPADAEALREILQPEIPPSIVVRCDMPARIEWWPLVLRDELNPEQVKAAGLKVYASRPSGLVVAVNWKQGRAYYWTG